MENSCKVELLAPAGNAEGFYGAVHAGADAVYLAGDRFGARAYAQNFTSQELLECIRYGHLLGRKIYLTVNTLLKEKEISGLYDYLAPFYEAGLDAVIVQDLGVLRFVREYFPGLKIHVSTQMTICDGLGASLLREMGACRVVPARELGLSELTAMKRRAGIEIEAFVHGAMCYCYSGQCLFSSILGGRSGNRGRCAQPCRLPYSVSVTGGKQEGCYPLSLKDMCTIEHIPQLIEAGIDSFKIEGRMKKPEYAAGVTDIYRRYIDRYYELRRRKGIREAEKAYRVERRDLEALSSLYVRSGLQDGYYFRRNGRDMVTLDSPAYRESDESLLAKIRERHIGSPLKLPVSLSAVFRIGMPAKVTLRWENVSASAQGEPVEAAQKQPITEENIRKQLSKLGDSAFCAVELEIALDEGCFYPLKQINELRRAAVAQLEEKVLRARGYESGKKADACGLEACDPKEDEMYAAVDGEYESGAEPDDCEAGYGPEKCGIKDCGNAVHPDYGYAFYARTSQQLTALTDWLLTENPQLPCRIYVDSDLLLQGLSAASELRMEPRPEKQSAVQSAAQWTSSTEKRSAQRSESRPDVQLLCEKLVRAINAELFIALPYILRETDRGYLEELSRKTESYGLFRGFLARSMDGISFVREKHKNMSLRTDAGVYLWNEYAAEELSALAEGFCLPYELNVPEQQNLLKRLSEKGLLDRLSCEKMVYGRIPMMVTANCVKRTMGRCDISHKTAEESMHSAASQVTADEKYRDVGSSAGKGREPSEEWPARPDAVLTDRYRKKFPVVTNCRHCMNILYNSVPFSLHQSFPARKGDLDLRMDFTIETPEEVKRVLDCFLKGAPFAPGEYTTGHEKRGVE